ncbi:hypothetical protein CgunFtcFv8_020185 [Champsocephalus gunnari]|nr:hypothetical protein CgunFtcFv8_020185 [Champsocephalus gunnari]
MSEALPVSPGIPWRTGKALMGLSTTGLTGGSEVQGPEAVCILAVKVLTEAADVAPGLVSDLHPSPDSLSSVKAD